jgi:hypothetical protein
MLVRVKHWLFRRALARASKEIDSQPDACWLRAIGLTSGEAHELGRELRLLSDLTGWPWARVRTQSA